MLIQRCLLIFYVNCDLKYFFFLLLSLSQMTNIILFLAGQFLIWQHSPCCVRYWSPYSTEASSLFLLLRTCLCSIAHNKHFCVIMWRAWKALLGTTNGGISLAGGYGTWLPWEEAHPPTVEMSRLTQEKCEAWNSSRPPTWVARPKYLSHLLLFSW